MTEPVQRSLLARTASGVFLAKILGSGLGLASQILLARLLGAESFGHYSYALSASYLLLLFVTMGLDKGALRFVSAYRARDEDSLLRGYISYAHKLVILSSLVVASLAAGVIYLLQGEIGSELALTSIVACLVLPTSAVAELAAACLQSLQRVAIARAVLEIFRPLVLTVGALIAYLTVVKGDISGYQAMALNVVGHFGGALILSLVLAKAIKSAIPIGTKLYKAVEWRRTSWQLALLGGLHLVVGQTDVLMLGMLRDTTEAGIYGVASKVASLALFGLIAGNAIVAPMISALFSRNEMAKLQEVIALAAKGTFVVTLLLSVGIVVFRTTILSAFGPKFLASETGLLILLAGQVVNALMGPVGFIMTMTMHQALAAKVIGFCAVMNIALNLAFIPRWGLEGAALATAISTASWNITLAIMTRRYLGLRPSFF